MFREAKLVELRRKTDRELVFLLRKELARGLRLAEAAGTKESELYVQAERAYLMSTAWLLLVSDLGRDERRELEFSLKELKSAVERTTLQKDAARRCGCISGLGAPRQQMVEHLVYASPDIAQFWNGCPYVIDFELAVRVGFERYTPFMAL
jgi:hypothetical protein